ncbi:MAG: ABC transporter ATP-binding protein [Thermoprotei archaeon]|nr:MAG: ABC transporter ATP-binding protein [Thermoprotei archaeon]
MAKAIVAKNVVKRYITRVRKGLVRSVKKIIEALRGVSFEVRHGEVVGLLGPNGAGKTTAVKIIATLLLPDDGEVYVEGFDVVREANEVRKRIGLLLSVEKGFYGKLTGRENLEYFGALYGIPRSVLRRRIDELMKLLELDKLGASSRLYEEYSLGMKARLGLARALLKDPPILLLDEPTLGLDPPSARKIRSVVKELARNGKAVLYTTHNMFEAEIVCDRILLINRGKIVAEGSPEELKSKIPQMRTVVVYVRGFNPNDVERVAELVGVKPSLGIDEEGFAMLKFQVRKPEEVLNDIVKGIAKLGCEIARLRIEEPTLEDVFLYFASR